MALQVINIKKWIADNDKSFLPPVCNKMMHNEQLKVMCVGGPNIRKDYHIEEGEEFFYMIKGDMCLKVIEQGKRKDIPIKEGQAFLLPAYIPHSPQRFENTVGLVIERRRDTGELDILRYYVDGTTDVLYEKAFYCENLGVELVPIIKAFFSSEACKTGVPDKNNILDEMPFRLSQRNLAEPFALSNMLSQLENAQNIFSGKNQFVIKMYSEGEDNLDSEKVEHWIWQNTGSSVVNVNNTEKVLEQDDCILIPTNTSYSWKRTEDSKSLLISQRGPKN